MGPDATPLILIAFLVLIGVPVLSIVAYVRVSAVKRSVESDAALLIRRIYALEQQMAQIEKGLASLATPAARIPQREAPEPAGAFQHRRPRCTRRKPNGRRKPPHTPRRLHCPRTSPPIHAEP